MCALDYLGVICVSLKIVVELHSVLGELFGTNDFDTISRIFMLFSCFNE